MNNRRDKLLAALLTLIIGALLTTTLLVVSIGPSNAQIKPAEQEEIYFADIDIPDFEEILPRPMDDTSNNPASSTPGDPGGADTKDSGSSDAEPTLVTSEEPQPEDQQVEPKEEPQRAAPSREEIEAEQQSKARSTLGKVDWNKKTDDNGAGGQNPDGKVAKGDNPDSGGLDVSGRSIRRKPKPNLPSKFDLNGTVKFKIYVDKDGNVLSNPKPRVVYTSGLGPDEANIQKILLDATMQLKYSADADKPRQEAIITWKI